MSRAYRHEPFIPATRVTAAANLSVLRTKAASRRWDLTPDQARAAMRVADQLDKIIADRDSRRR